ncbi:hypothetical protein AABB24_023599 [Solanum stoloniferum]|uniref:Uncharacterized protein n=1 Tax=Solanum stoloniferum TaxID=62892 RepID=A0ABD2SK63_9SOLN
MNDVSYNMRKQNNGVRYYRNNILFDHKHVWRMVGDFNFILPNCVIQFLIGSYLWKFLEFLLGSMFIIRIITTLLLPVLQILKAANGKNSFVIKFLGEFSHHHKT